MKNLNDENKIRFFSRKEVPVEMHKVKVVQSINLAIPERRMKAIEDAGFNTFLLQTGDIFLDMLTDSGTNAMSDEQVSKMFVADDAYAGSKSFLKLKESIFDVLGKELVLPVHQGRAAENIISSAYVGIGSHVPMNYHFTTTLAHIEKNGGKVAELYTPEAMKIASTHPFKGNMDIGRLEEFIERHGKERIPFIRMEASTNLIGGQPFSMQNFREVKKVADKNGIPVVLDASLIGENAYFILKREPGFAGSDMKSILREMCSLADIVYFSARKLSSARGGAICTNSKEHFDKMKDLVPLFEGFLTYGGISVREIEAMAVGLRETTEENVAGQSPQFIEYMVKELQALSVPVISPGGALGCHIDAGSFAPHIPQREYPAGAVTAAFFIVSGIRGMERGTISSTRDAEGREIMADMELMRLALPRRLFTLSQIEFAIDRLHWLFENRNLIGGLRFTEEPPVLRFFTGRLEPVNDWPKRLLEKFQKDFSV